MNEKILSDEILIEKDPFLKLFFSKLDWSSEAILLFASIISTILFIGIGSIASNAYTGTGKHIFSIDNIGFAIVWILLFSPLMWGLFLWQARKAPKYFEGLIGENIFGSEGSDKRVFVVREINNLYGNMNAFWVYLVVLVFFVAFWGTELCYTWPRQFLISKQYWYEVKWYLPIHIFAWSFGLYPLFVAVTRQVFFVFGLSKILNKIDVEIKPLHPDEVGGMSGIGSFVKDSMWFVFGMGFIAVLFAIEVSLTGATVFQRTDVISLFFLYVLLAPICLLLPIFSSRNSMTRARDKYLQPISTEIHTIMELAQNTISHPTEKELRQIDDKVEQLVKHREMICQLYPISPLPINIFRNFSITATIPVISGLVSVVVQFLSK